MRSAIARYEQFNEKRKQDEAKKADNKDIAELEKIDGNIAESMGKLKGIV